MIQLVLLYLREFSLINYITPSYDDSILVHRQNMIFKYLYDPHKYNAYNYRVLNDFPNMYVRDCNCMNICKLPKSYFYYIK